jgi:hypothetical protein
MSALSLKSVSLSPLCKKDSQQLKRLLCVWSNVTCQHVCVFVSPPPRQTSSERGGGGGGGATVHGSTHTMMKVTCEDGGSVAGGGEGGSRGVVEKCIYTIFDH